MIRKSLDKKTIENSKKQLRIICPNLYKAKNFNFLGIFAASTDWARQGVHVAGDQIQVTREKMEQLRRIMEERKAKRRARREARAAPYSTSWSLKSSSTASSEVDAELANLQVKMS